MLAAERLCLAVMTLPTAWTALGSMRARISTSPSW
jgi:hypothetical protein